MVARRDKRCRAHSDQAFAPPGADGLGGYSVRPPVPDQLQNGAREQGLALAKLSSGDDDVFVVPGQLTIKGSPAQINDALAALDGRGFEPIDSFEAASGDGVVTVLSVSPAAFATDDAAAVRATFEALELLLSSPAETLAPSAGFEVAPVYGLLAHQTTHPGADPEPTAQRLRPPAGKVGDAVKIVVLDTGLWSGWTWAGAGGPVPAPEGDPCRAAGAPNYLGIAGGHGTFIAGVLRQLVPAATLVVRRVAGIDGLVDESSFRRALDEVARVHHDADVVVIASGGTSLPLASGGRSVAIPPTGWPRGARDWNNPVQLRQGIASVLKHTNAVVVMSAGNNDSCDPCFPAAFAGPQWAGPFGNSADRLVSVAALDAEGFRAAWSNFGNVTDPMRDWVVASTAGVRIVSTFVHGVEDPANDPDDPPGTWPTTDAPFASWSGTSFAAPIVAGRIAEQLWQMRSASPSSTPVAAWNALRSSSSVARSLGCGVHISEAGVARES